jgi:hypothetical protein
MLASGAARLGEVLYYFYFLRSNVVKEHTTCFTWSSVNMFHSKNVLPTSLMVLKVAILWVLIKYCVHVSFTVHSPSCVTARFCDSIRVSLQFRSRPWRRRVLQAVTNTSYPLAPGLLTLSATRLTWRPIARSLLREGTDSGHKYEGTWRKGKTWCLALCCVFNVLQLINPCTDQETNGERSEIRKILRVTIRCEAS